LQELLVLLLLLLVVVAVALILQPLQRLHLQTLLQQPLLLLLLLLPPPQPHCCGVLLHLLLRLVAALLRVATLNCQQRGPCASRFPQPTHPTSCSNLQPTQSGSSRSTVSQRIVNKMVACVGLARKYKKH
jgi:hypothetical protein